MLLVSGIGIAVLFVVTAAAASRSGIVPQVLLSHGEEPLSRYNWVHPPPHTATGNGPAQPGAALVRLAASGLPPRSVTTGDGQCTVIIKENSLAPRAGESAVRVRILPMDPARVAQVPSGRRFDSNAYRIEGTYPRSGAAVVLRGPVTVVLRAATGGTEIVWHAGAGWTVLQTAGYPLAVVVADTPNLGTFAVLAPQTPGHAVPRGADRLSVIGSLSLPRRAHVATLLRTPTRSTNPRH